MNSPEQIDKTIDQLVLLRKVSAFANLGIYAGPGVLRQAIRHIDELVQHPTDVGLSCSRDALHSMNRNVLPGQRLCQASVAEVDQMLVPLRAQRRGEVNGDAQRPRPN